MIDLRDFNDRYRVQRDPNEADTTLLYILGRKYKLGRAHVFVWGEERMAVFIPSGEASRNLMRRGIPGMKIEQQGDDEMPISFPPEALDQVAKHVGLHRRRHLSPEHREKMARVGKKSRFATALEPL